MPAPADTARTARAGARDLPALPVRLPDLSSRWDGASLLRPDSIQYFDDELRSPVRPLRAVGLYQLPPHTFKVEVSPDVRRRAVRMDTALRCPRDVDTPARAELGTAANNDHRGCFANPAGSFQ